MYVNFYGAQVRTRFGGAISFERKTVGSCMRSMADSSQKVQSDQGKKRFCAGRAMLEHTSFTPVEFTIFVWNEMGSFELKCHSR